MVDLVTGQAVDAALAHPTNSTESADKTGTLLIPAQMSGNGAVGGVKLAV
jgi:hypothetical protein